MSAIGCSHPQVRACCLLALALMTAKANAQGCTLRIHVDGLRNSTGVVGTVLFASPDGFPDKVSGAFRAGPTSIPAGQREVTAVWDRIPAGDYAVLALHDENANAKLDRNMFGWPKEGFGFANNPRIFLAPPPFQKAEIHVGCPVTEIAIHVLYK